MLLIYVQFLRVFFEKRRTRLSIFFLSLAPAYVLTVAAFVLGSYPLIMTLASVISLLYRLITKQTG